MFSIQSKKIVALLMASLITAVSLFVSSCQKELSGNGFSITETPPDLTTKISSTVSGFITNETDAAVNGATVQAGGSSTTTDKYGYFEISNVQVVKNAAVVTVSKPGYFNGIKTFIASAGHSGFFRIKLLPKTIQGNFDAATGGTVTLTNGLSFTFPAGAVVLASSTSTAYTGQVSVAAQWLNPTANDIHQTMPGDLRGLDSLGFMRVLTTYGMSATELTGAGGELLQIATGKKATISFPISSAANASAPSNIPLWYFDETIGLWKEQGNAVKSGSTYVGEVSHFSWWNCDLPNATVPLIFNVVDGTGQPVSGVYVNIVPTTSNSWSHAGGYTDSTGHVSVLVTANASYTLSIYGDCGSWNNPAYTQDFSVGTTPVDLGNITLTGPSVANVSGTVECTGSPLADAYVVMTKGYYNFRYPVNADGTYSFTTTICSGSAPVTLVAENLSTMQSGTSQTFTLVSGNNTVPALQACTFTIEQFIHYSVNGTSYSADYPADSIYHGVNTQVTPPASVIYGSGPSIGTPGLINFSFTQNGIAAGNSQTLLSFYGTGITDSSAVLTGTPVVNITEYGNVGEFIAGNFVCTITTGPPPGTANNVTCSFRARRRQ
jgi:hypothetical protein